MEVKLKMKGVDKVEPVSAVNDVPFVPPDSTTVLTISNPLYYMLNRALTSGTMGVGRADVWNVKVYNLLILILIIELLLIERYHFSAAR